MFKCNACERNLNDYSIIKSEDMLNGIDSQYRYLTCDNCHVTWTCFTENTIKWDHKHVAKGMQHFAQISHTTNKTETIGPVVSLNTSADSSQMLKLCSMSIEAEHSV